MARRMVLTWSFIIYAVVNCEAVETIRSLNNPHDDIASLVSSLNNDLSSTAQELNEMESQLTALLNDMEEYKSTACLGCNCHALSEWRDHVFQHLENMEQEMEEEINNAVQQKKKTVDDLSSALTLQNDSVNLLEALHAALESSPGIRVMERIQDFKQKLGEVPESLPAASALVQRQPKDCWEAQTQGSPSGVTKIWPSGDEPKEVNCIQDNDGGGWTVVIHRQKQTPQLNFNQYFIKYQTGFGDPSGEYWIGLDTLHELTGGKPYELLVTMAIGDEKATSFYKQFQVEGASDYKLRVSGYDPLKSTGGDSLTYHDGKGFTTRNRDRDGASGGNCASWSGGGGWWFDYCYMTNPTGLYPGIRSSTQESDSYLEWRNWQGYHRFLTDFTMMIRPQQN